MFNDYLVNSPEYDRDFWNAVRGNSNAKKNLDAGKHNMTGTFKLPGDRKSTRLNSSHNVASRMPSSA